MIRKDIAVWSGTVRVLLHGGLVKIGRPQDPTALDGFGPPTLAALVEAASGRDSAGADALSDGRRRASRGAIARRLERVTRRANLAGWSLVLVLVLAAEAAVRLLDLHDSVAAPSASFRALAAETTSGALPGEIATTLEAYVQGLALAIAFAVPLGALIGTSRVLRNATSVVIEFLRPIPAVALIPLAILFFGFDTPMRRYVIAFAATWPILLNTMYGVRGVDRLLHDVAKASGVTAAGRLVRVTFPAALPSIASGIRVSASLALLVCVTAEFVTGTGGIGAYMFQQQNAFQLPELYAAIVLVGTLGYLVNRLLRVTEQRLLFWVGEARMAGR